MADAEQSAKAAGRAVQNVENTLEQALLVARRCPKEYLASEEHPAVRRMINQGFFKALYIGEDGSVERFEMTEPFATLLDRNLLRDLAEERQGDAREASLTTAANDAEDRSQPSAVFVNSFVCPSKTDKPDGGAVRLGSNKITLVREIAVRWNTLQISTELMHAKLTKLGFTCEDG